MTFITDSGLHIECLPALGDNANYIYILHEDGGNAVVIDPGEAEPVLKWANENNKHISHILNTHHHWDHINGNKAIHDQFGCDIYCFKTDMKRIYGTSRGLQENEVFSLLNREITTIFNPGHTFGSISYHLKEEGILFPADTIFAFGGGRINDGTPNCIFEGDAAMMFESLQQLKTLPPETLIFNAHEYALINGAFALEIFPNSQPIKDRIEHVKKLRAKNLPYQGYPLSEELNTNPFFLAQSVEEYATYREKRNHF